MAQPPASRRIGHRLEADEAILEAEGARAGEMQGRNLHQPGGIGKVHQAAVGRLGDTA